jgi:nitrogen regulatory protein PII
MAKESFVSRLFFRRFQNKAELPPKLKIIFFIVDRHQAHVINRVFMEEKVRFHFQAKGHGTATSEVLDLLGLGTGEKTIILCLEQEVLVPVLLKEVWRKVGLDNPGAGIAFTIPLSAINEPMLMVFKQSVHKNEKITAQTELNSKTGGGKMSSNFSHDLIVSIVNQGYSDEVMNTAREAGASGGTVLNVRGQGHEGAVKFFGISVQEEKELILILAKQEQKSIIMRAICETHGLNSRAQGFVFSLPVDSVMGLISE